MSPTFAQASALWRHPEYRRGIREMTGISLGIGAWGLVTGVAMVNSGLGVPLSLFMSLIVFAGSSQLASLPLIAAGAPIWVVWATAFCVNLRFVIFSAQWRPYFGHFPLRRRLALGYFCADLNYVMFMRRFPSRAPAPARCRTSSVAVSSNWVAWQCRRSPASCWRTGCRSSGASALPVTLVADRPDLCRWWSRPRHRWLAAGRGRCRRRGGICPAASQ